MRAGNPRQIPLPLRLDDDATFDNFLATPENAAVLRYLQQERREAGDDRASGTVLTDFAWLIGSPGAGKSHLLQALCHQEAQKGRHVFYLSLDEVAALDPAVLDGLEAAELLCVDDLNRVAGDNKWELALFNLYNRMAVSSTRFVVSATCGPRQLTTVLADLHSRWQSAAVFEVNALDDQGKSDALRMRARARGLELSDEVTAYLMSRSGRNMTVLLERLQALDVHSMETKRRITVPLVKSLMGW